MLLEALYFGKGWLIVLDLRPFETVFQSIPGRLPEREKEEKRETRE